jgi:tetratricopeptide (TPR) repeat protein
MSMPSSSTSSSDVLRLLKRAGLFHGGLVMIYAVMLFVLARTPAPDFNDYRYEYSLYQFITRDYTLPGGYGYTLKRFREITQYENLDMLFLGSSRCYYAFAPNVFSRLGLKTFNMGSPSQSPLNTRFLLERYYERLNPKLVVFEINPHILEKDGLESFYDLMINTPLSPEIFRMSLATRHPQAMNGLAVRALTSLTTPFETFQMQNRPMDRYHEGGALSSRNFNDKTFQETPSAVKIPEEQLNHLEAVVDFIQERGAELILVVAPIPMEWDGVITNYAEFSDAIEAVADAHQVRFYDFNRTLTLDTRTDFKDFHHLNANGAKIFSYDILDSLLDVPRYRAALDVDPLLAADVYAGRGIAFAEMGELDKAIIDYDRALALTPQAGEVHYNKGRACQKAGRIAEAIAAYRQFIRYAPVEYRKYIEPVRAQIRALEQS